MTKQDRFRHRLEIKDLSKPNGVVILNYNKDFDKPNTIFKTKCSIST